MGRLGGEPDSADDPSAFVDVAQALRASAAWLTNEIIDEIVENVPNYASVSRVSLSQSLLRHIETAAHALTIGEAPDGVQDVSVAAARARAGIPIEHVLLAIRTAFQVLREFVIRAAADAGIESWIQLEAVRILWEVNDLVSREFAVAHREADLDMARMAETHRVEFVRQLLREGVSSADMGMLATSFGLVSTARYRAFRARPADGQDAGAVLQEILTWGTAHRLGPFGAVVEGDAAGVLACDDLPDNGPTVGIGPAVELNRVPESFRLAGQAIDVGLGFERTGLQTLEDLSLHVAVASEHVVGDSLVERFLAPLLEQGDFGHELVASLDTFLAKGMNTAKAAEVLVVHPNTMRYRINQVKALTGVDLDSGQEISEVWWALRRHEWARHIDAGPPTSRNRGAERGTIDHARQSDSPVSALDPRAR
jgi:hypothetical protein